MPVCSQKNVLIKKRMLNELIEAPRIQLNLFPHNPPVVNGFKVTEVGLCQEVGGDWFDYIPYDDGRLNIIIVKLLI